MRRTVRGLWISAAVAVAVFGAAPAQAEGLAPEDLAAAAQRALEAIDPDRPVVVVLDDAVPPIGVLNAFGAPATVLSRAQARDEQRAWFVYLDAATEVPGGLRTVWSQPARGAVDVVVLHRSDQGWAVASRSSEHSSSGARHFYGELYDGVACRNGTEMARRWRLTEETIKALIARKPMPSEPSSSKCPGKAFPEVAAYQSMKR